jgi:signal transduction histidine kinase
MQCGPKVAECLVLPMMRNLAMKSWYPAESGGMGIGLSTWRSIIDAQGGRLSVSDNVGPGAAFQFTLPLRGEDDPP